MEDLEGIIKKASSLHSSIAQDVFPTGCILTCKKCERKVPATTGDCASYFKHGWPICCGESMMIREKDQPKEGKP